MRRWLITKLGGFPDLDAAITRIKNSGDAVRKHEILTEAVKRLYNAIGPDDILHQNDQGLWEFQGKAITEPEMRQLREEAKILLSMKLWRVLKLDIKYQLGKKMFEEASNLEALVWGKLLTFHDDILRTRLQRLK